MCHLQVNDQMRFSTESDDESQEELEHKFGRRTRLLSVDTDDSSSDSDEGTDDSEEEAFPVSKRANLGLYSQPDAYDVFTQKTQQKAWLNATTEYSKQVADLQKNELRLRQQTEQARQAKRQKEMQEVTNMLNALEVSRKQEEAALLSAFDARNKELWVSIENAIKAKEQEQAALQAARQKQIEAEQKAKADREAAIAKAEAAEKEAKDKAKAEAKLKEEQEAKLAQQSATSSIQKETWDKWHEAMQRIKTDVLPAVSSSTEWKRVCREAKRTITPKVGQVTNSTSHIATIAAQLSSALGNLQTASQQAYIWGLNHLCKALIRQAETEVTARQQVAFPLARLMAALIFQHNHAQLADVLMARLVKKCFWVTGYYPPRSLFPDDTSHSKALGHNVQSPEPLMGYAQRMTGIMSLYAAIVSVFAADGRSPSQFQPAALWTLLVSLFSTPLSALEPVPQLIESILTMAGRIMLSAYGKQWAKLWQCLLEQGLRAKQASFNDKDAGWVKASIAKLTLLLEEWKTKGIQAPEGSQPEA